MIPGDYTLQLFRGRARTWRAQLFQDAEATQTVDLTGCTPVAGITTPAGKIELACTVVDEEGIDPEDGWVEISITAGQAEDLTGTLYSWTMGIEDSLGDWTPALKGPVLVETDDSL